MNHPHLPNLQPATRNIPEDHSTRVENSTRVEISARAESLEQHVRMFLLDRGCAGLGVKVRPSAVVADLFYVRLENRISQTSLEITGEDMDSVMQALPLKCSTSQVMDAAMQMESYVSC